MSVAYVKNVPWISSKLSPLICTFQRGSRDHKNRIWKLTAWKLQVPALRKIGFIYSQLCNRLISNLKYRIWVFQGLILFNGSCCFICSLRECFFSCEIHFYGLQRVERITEEKEEKEKEREGEKKPGRKKIQQHSRGYCKCKAKQNDQLWQRSKSAAL